MNNKDKNVLALAYIGDAVYEIYVRKFLLEKGLVKVKDLQEEAVKYVSAKSQCKFLNQMIENGILTEEEIDVVKRARNHKGCSHPKNTDIVTYKHATGLEALIGFLYLDEKISRIDTIMKIVIGE